MKRYKVTLTPSIKRRIQRLKKRYPKVSNDVKEVIQHLLHNPQEGTVIPNDFGVRKLRVRNSNLNKGKSAGYRLLYILIEDSEPILALLHIYAKSDQTNVTRTELANLLSGLDDN